MILAFCAYHMSNIIEIVSWTVIIASISPHHHIVSCITGIACCVCSSPARKASNIAKRAMLCRICIIEIGVAKAFLSRGLKSSFRNRMTIKTVSIECTRTLST